MLRPQTIAFVLAALLSHRPSFAGGPGPAPRADRLGICTTCSLNDASPKRLACTDGQPCFSASRACRVEVTLTVQDRPGAKADQVCPGRLGCTCTKAEDCAPAFCLSDQKPNNSRNRCQFGNCTSDADCDGTECVCAGGSCEPGELGLCSVPCPGSNAAITVGVTVTPRDGERIVLPSRSFGNCDNGFDRFYCPDDREDPDLNATPGDPFCSRNARRMTEMTLLSTGDNDLALQSLQDFADDLRTACGAAPDTVPLIVPPVGPPTDERRNQSNEGPSSRSWCVKVYFREP